MTKMKHAQLVAKRKLKASELDDLELKFDFGHIAKSFQEMQGQNVLIHKMALTDPALFYQGIRRGYDDKQLEFRVWELAQKVKHITIPRRTPEDWRVAYEISPKTNQIKSLRIIKKSEINDFYPKYLSGRHLDLSLVSNPGSGNNHACRVVVDFLRKEILPKGKLSDNDYIEFLADDKHCKLACRENHLPKIPRPIACKREAPKKLINGYRWDEL